MMVVHRAHYSPFPARRYVRRTLDRYPSALPARQAGHHWHQRNRLPVDVYTTPEAFVVVANMPGVDADDVDTTIEGDTLTIKATLPERAEDVEYSLRERDEGEVERTLRFNVPIDPEAASAAFENGVLTLTVPKADEAKPRTIQVRAG